MDYFNCNLAIHYTIPDKLEKELTIMCLAMPHGIESSDGSYRWYGNETDERFIEANFEPSGLHFYARLPRDEWEEWLELFKQRASEVMGYEVGEPEDGYEFIIYETKPRGLLSRMKNGFS